MVRLIDGQTFVEIIEQEDHAEHELITFSHTRYTKGREPFQQKADLDLIYRFF